MKHLRARVAHARHSDRGAVLPILALFIVVLVLATSLAVDIGRLSNRNRDLQKIADLVSLDAVRELGNTNSAALAVTGSSFLQAVQSSAANNGFPVSCTTSATQPNYEADCTSTEAGSKDTLTVDLGLWCTADDVTDTSSPCNGATIPANKPGVLVYDTSGNNTPTAVQVTAGDFVKYYFGLGIVNGQSAARSGTSNLASTADFGLGTSLASLDTGESALLGPLLNSLFGFNLTTQVVGWKGLASGTVTLNDLATKLGLDVGDSSNLLNTNVSFADFVAATAQALTAEGDVVDAGLLNSVAANIPSPLRNVTLSLGDLFDVGASDVGAALSSKVNVLQLVSAAAQVANGSNALTVTPASLVLPGIATVSGINLKVIQPVKFKYRAHVGDSLEAGQATLSVNLANINPSLVTGVIGGLLPGLLGLNATITPADTTVGIANGRATLTDVSCTPTPSFTLAVSSGAATLTTTLSLNVSASLLLVPNALKISGSITATQSQSDQSKSVTFSFPPDTPGSAKDASTSSLFWGSPQITSNTLKVSLIGLTLPLGSLLQGLTSGLVTPLLGAINSQVIQPMQSLLGLTVGDATVFSGSDDPPVHCNTPQLVQ